MGGFLLLLNISEPCNRAVFLIELSKNIYPESGYFYFIFLWLKTKQKSAITMPAP
jgi:hypothetical protein